VLIKMSSFQPKITRQANFLKVWLTHRKEAVNILSLRKPRFFRLTEQRLFFFLTVLGFEHRAYTLSNSTFFVIFFFFLR
jgi:hypothetical protein